MSEGWLPSRRDIAADVETKLAAHWRLLRNALLSTFCFLAILIQIAIVVAAVVIVLPLVDALPDRLLLSSIVLDFINFNPWLSPIVTCSSFIATDRQHELLLLQQLVISGSSLL